MNQDGARLVETDCFASTFFPLMHATLIGFWYLLALDLLMGLRGDRRCIHDWVSGTKVVAVAGDKN